jgi:Uma2 family endonuclease
MSDAVRQSEFPSLPPGEDELPCRDGEPMESERHAKQKNLLAESLALAWADRTDVYVGNEMAIYFSELQARNNDFRAPDVFVVLDTTRRVRKSWVVWQEGGRTPDVVIELLSASTEAVDRGDKMRIYSRILRVSNYYLFDPDSGVFEGYRLDPDKRQYAPLAPQPGGDLPCPVLGLSLGLRPGTFQSVELSWLRWITPDGAVLPSGEEAARSAQEQARSAQEQARRAQEQARSAQEEARSAQEEARRAQEEARSAQEQARSAEDKAATLTEQLAQARAEIERFKVSGGTEKL